MKSKHVLLFGTILLIIHLSAVAQEDDLRSYTQAKLIEKDSNIAHRWPLRETRQTSRSNANSDIQLMNPEREVTFGRPTSRTYPLTYASSTSWNWQIPIPQGNDLFRIRFANADTGWAVGRGGTILRTTNGGLSWEIQLTEGKWDLFGFHILSPNTAVAVGAEYDVTRYPQPVTNSVVLHTSDGGENWIRISGITNRGLFAVHFANSMCGTAVGMFGTLIHTSDGGSTWGLQSSGTQIDLLDVHFASCAMGTAVGKNGTIIRTTDGGNTWSNQMSGTQRDLFKVAFTGNTGFVVGDFGTILKTTNGGESWEAQSIGGGYLLDVCVFDQQRVFAVGADNAIYRTTNGGMSWLPCDVELDPSRYYTFCSVSFADSLTGFVVGFYGIIQATSDGGTTWRRKSMYNFGIMKLSFLDSETGCALTTDRIFRTTNGGKAWRSVLPPQNAFLTGIFLHRLGRGIAVGSHPAEGARILLTTNGGLDWTSSTWSQIRHLQEVAFSSNLNAVAVGTQGSILHTTNGGESWNSVSSGTTNDLTGVAFSDSNVGICVGENGTILRTTNGGSSWTHQNSGTTRYIGGVSCVDNFHAIVVGATGLILGTSDGGSTWQSRPSGVTADLGQVAFADNNNGLAGGDMNGALLQTTDGGTTWAIESYPLATGGANSIVYRSDHKVWVGGPSGILSNSTGAALQPPTLVSPYNGALNLPSSVRLEWRAVENVNSYQLQLATDTAFLNLIINDLSLLDTTRIVPNLQPSTWYFWRVSARHIGGTSNYSTPWSFNVSGVPPQVLLVSPPNNAVNQQVSVTFSWHRATDHMSVVTPFFSNREPYLSSVNEYFGPAHSGFSALGTRESKNLLTVSAYWIELMTDTTGQPVVKDTSLTDTIKSVNGLSHLTNYYWRVRAKNEFGWGEFSEWWRFMTIAAPPPGWFIQTSGTNSWLLGLHCISSTKAIAVGQNGTILRTSNGGFTWARVVVATNVDLFGVSMADSMYGMAVGQNGICARTTDSGLSWQVGSIVGGVNLYAVSCPTYRTATAVGGSGTIMRTTDNGVSWTQQTSGTTQFLWGVSFIDSTHGIAVGGSAVLVTTNGGLTWSNHSPAGDLSLQAVHMIDLLNAFAVGHSGVILKTTNGGMNWVPLVSGTSNSFFGVHFVNQSTGMIAGAQGTIIRTSNGGQSWIPQVTNTSRSIQSIQLVTDSLATAVGDSGLILRTVSGGTLVSVSYQPTIPNAFDLLQNYPNPFNPVTILRYDLPIASDVLLRVYNIMGQEVATLVDDNKPAGHHQISWHPQDIASGVYLCRLQAGKFTKTRKLLLLR